MNSSFGEESMSWYQAKDFCKRTGGKLVEINSDEENRAIVDEIQRKGYRDRKMYFWMGLTDLSEEGIWKLVSSCENASYLNWDKRTGVEPDNYGEQGEGCAYLRSGGCADWDHSGWADLDCSKNGVIIQCGWSETTYSMHPLCDCQERKSGKYLINQLCHQILFDLHVLLVTPTNFVAPK